MALHGTGAGQLMKDTSTGQARVSSLLVAPNCHLTGAESRGRSPADRRGGRALPTASSPSPPSKSRGGHCPARRLAHGHTVLHGTHTHSPQGAEPRMATSAGPFSGRWTPRSLLHLSGALAGQHPTSASQGAPQAQVCMWPWPAVSLAHGATLGPAGSLPETRCCHPHLVHACHGGVLLLTRRCQWRGTTAPSHRGGHRGGAACTAAVR